MPVFAKKEMALRDWKRLQDEIVHLQFRLKGPHELMMFVVENSRNQMHTVYLGLPVAVPLTFFPGFRVVERSSLPGLLLAAVCREDGFRERFPDIAAKRAYQPKRMNTAGNTSKQRIHFV